MNFTQDLTNKSFIVTGATSGIGKSAYLALHEAGAKVLPIGRNRESLSALPCRFPQGPLFADLEHPTELKVLISKLQQQGVILDGLLYSAGNFVTSPIEETTEDEWARVFSVNFHSFRHLVVNAISAELFAPKSSIVAISSILASFGASNTGAYSSSKGALCALTRALSVEYGDRGMRFNTISPGHVKTPLIADLLKNADDVYRITCAYPLGRIGDAEDVSNLALFLLSGFSSWITGSNFEIDGGRSISC